MHKNFPGTILYDSSQPGFKGGIDSTSFNAKIEPHEIIYYVKD
jgi:hypothetical protein